MTTPDAQKVADGLSEAQRNMFLHPLLAPVNTPRGIEGGIAKILLLPTSPAKPEGCFSFYTTTPGYEKYRLTPLGLAVRSYLMGEKG